MGRIKAKPETKPIVKAIATGSNPAAKPTGIAIGKTIATAAALLTASVKNKVNNTNSANSAKPTMSPGINV